MLSYCSYPNSRRWLAASPADSKSRLPMTTRRGWCARKLPSLKRAVSEGLSASAVPVPTTMASRCALSACTQSRAASPVIHWLVPSAAAVKPSSVCANFKVMWGRWVRTANSHGTKASSTCGGFSSLATSTPASANTSAPPAACGVGSAWR